MNRRTTASARERSEHGANLVEMALVLPLLLLLVAAIADFGRAFNSYITISNAAREAARVGSRVPEHNEVIDGYIRAAAIKEAANSGIDLTDSGVATIVIEPELDDRWVAEPITVTVEYSMTTIFTGLVGLDTIPIRSRSVMVMVYGEEPGE